MTMICEPSLTKKRPTPPIANNRPSSTLCVPLSDCPGVSGTRPKLIRTSGELRISNFLLWQLAYSELVFTECRWPEFGPDDLRAAVDEYSERQRRFGRR